MSIGASGRRISRIPRCLVAGIGSSRRYGFDVASFVSFFRPRPGLEGPFGGRLLPVEGLWRYPLGRTCVTFGRYPLGSLIGDTRQTIMTHETAISDDHTEL